MKRNATLSNRVPQQPRFGNPAATRQQWWNKPRSFQGEKTLNQQHPGLKFGNYMKACRAFGMQAENPFSTQIADLVVQDGVKLFKKLSDGIKASLTAPVKPAEPLTETGYSRYFRAIRFDIGDIIPLRGWHDKEPEAEDPGLHDRLMGEIPLFIECLPFLRSAQLLGKSSVCGFWRALKAFRQHYPLATALELAAIANEGQKSPLVFFDFYRPSTDLGFPGEFEVEVEKTPPPGLPDELRDLYQATGSLVAAWLVKVGKLSQATAKHIASQMNTDWLEFDGFLENPVFLQLPAKVAARLCLGMRPAELAPGLTRAEAHQWLMYMANRPEEERSKLVMPLAWVAIREGLDADIYGALSAPTTTLIKWLAKKQHTTAFRAFKRVYRQGKTELVSFKAYLDEITEEDLVNGMETSPFAALTAARIRGAQQLSKARLGRELALTEPFPDPAIPESEGIVRVKTVPDLVGEGVEMNHCVGGVSYQLKCAMGTDAVFRIETAEGRSTLQMVRGSNGWYIGQHLGYSNTAAPGANRELVKEWFSSLDIPKRPDIKEHPFAQFIHIDRDRHFANLERIMMYYDEMAPVPVGRLLGI